MQDDNRETEIEIKKPKILSNWDREEIFFVRWITFISATAFCLVIWGLLFNLSGHMVWLILIADCVFPPVFFFRKQIKILLKEKISYWWSMLNGRIP